METTTTRMTTTTTTTNDGVNQQSASTTSSSDRTSCAALSKVLKLQKSFPVELRDKYSERYSKLLQEMMLSDKHTEGQVKTVIKAFPSALSHLDDDGRLPIHSAACFKRSIPFVPFLLG